MEEYFEKLSYGLVWYGENGRFKEADAQDNPYFDASKPTMIYSHGWQPDSSINQVRENFNWSHLEGPDLNLADYWVKKGWNIGIFYWNQFSDEPEVKDAEAKIWTAQGPQEMRWRKTDGSYEYHSVKQSAGELFYNAFEYAMKNYRGNDIRIAGHSLGNQMASRLVKQILDHIRDGKLPDNLKPKRISLLDPFWSQGEKDYLGGRWNGEVIRDYLKEFKEAGIIIEQYRSSAVTTFPGIGDENKDLCKMTCFTEWKPHMFKRTDFFDRKHHFGAWHYFWSMAFPAPKDEDGDTAASASTDNGRILEMMNSPYKWVQTQGLKTKTPEDDVFSKFPR